MSEKLFDKVNFWSILTMLQNKQINSSINIYIWAEHRPVSVVAQIFVRLRLLSLGGDLFSFFIRLRLLSLGGALFSFAHICFRYTSLSTTRRAPAQPSEHRREPPVLAWLCR